MQIINENSLSSGKVAVVFNFIENRGKLTQYIKHMKEHNINVNEILWVSLFDFNLKKPSVGDVRKGVIELEESLKSTSVNVVIDMTSSYDDKQKKYVKGLMFKGIFKRDNNLWQHRGVLEASIGDWSGKFIQGLRWESIAREKDSRKLIESEFVVKPEKVTIEIPKTIKEAKEAFKELFKSKEIVYDTEGSSVMWERSDFKVYTLQYTGLENKNKSIIFFYEHPKVPKSAEFKDIVKKGTKWIMENRKVIIHNASYDMLLNMRFFDVDIYKTDFYCTFILWAFLTNTYKPVPLGLKDISFTEGIFLDWEYKLKDEKARICKEMDIKSDNFKYEYFDVNDLTLYGGYDTIVLAHLWGHMKEVSKNHIALDVIKKTWEGEEGWMNLMKGTYSMMYNGSPFNLKKAKALWQKNTDRVNEIDELIKEDNFIKGAEKNINEVQWKKALVAYDKKVQEKAKLGKVFGGKPPEREKGKYGSINYNVSFNTKSPAHKKILFLETLKLPVIEKSKQTGEASFGEKSINEYLKLRPEISTLQLFGEKAKLSKIIGTYLDPWIDKVSNSFDGNLHGSFNPVTTSARYKGSEGSLLNITKGVGLKELLESDYENGRCTLALDMKSMEERVGLLLHKDKVKLKMKEEGITDPHAFNSFIVAKALGDTSIDNLDKFNPEHLKIIKNDFGKLRQKTKAFVFGLAYGISHFGLMKAFNCNEQVAKKMLNDYWEVHKDEAKYIADCALEFQDKGYSINFGNVPILTPNMTTDMEDKENSSNFKTCYNSKGQSSAYLVVRAMYLADKHFKEKGMDVKFTNSIYDSVILDCKLEDTIYVRKKCIEYMTLPIMKDQLFPLGADCEIGISYEPELDFEGTDEELEDILTEFKEKHNSKV